MTFVSISVAQGPIPQNRRIATTSNQDKCVAGRCKQCTENNGCSFCVNSKRVITNDVGSCVDGTISNCWSYHSDEGFEGCEVCEGNSPTYLGPVGANNAHKFDCSGTKTYTNCVLERAYVDRRRLLSEQGTIRSLPEDPAGIIRECFRCSTGKAFDPVTTNACVDTSPSVDNCFYNRAIINNENKFVCRTCNEGFVLDPMADTCSSAPQGKSTCGVFFMNQCSMCHLDLEYYSTSFTNNETGQNCVKWTPPPSSSTGITNSLILANIFSTLTLAVLVLLN